MTSPQLDEEAVFHVARDLTNPEIRSKYLDQICAGDQALRYRVEALLKAHEQSQELLRSSDPELDSTAESTPLTERPGTMIGRYKLMEQIGEGGMGIVFVAEQERPIRRKVAIKVIKPGMDTKEVVARFEAERQALAMMDHPNIAKVLDAGTTESGRPYFAMELVRGVPITQYCDANKLSVPERLELFVEVCKAVQHAHQKGIIHRDLKPSNVLITLHDSVPVPKVIDFGVAKALNQKLTDKTVYTRIQQAIGTLAYMSPEQAELSGLDVDTRSDVYALGVLLYELLTGTTPFAERRLHEAAYHEACRIIRDEEPPRPSTRLSTLGDTATAVAANRRADAAQLGTIFRRELDWIVMKALEKNRTRRYETATDFSRDVKRYLHNEPVSACPPSVGYRFRKFAFKNRAWLLTAGLVCASLVLGTTLATWQAVVAQDRLAALQTALANWQHELFRRALAAAFAGDESQVASIIEDATTIAQSPPGWEGKIRGQLALFSGKVDEAIKILESSVEKDRKDAGALALLSLAHLDSGSHEDYLSARRRLADLLSQTPLESMSPEDQLLVAEAAMFGDIAAGVVTIESVIEKTPTPLALAFLCEAHIKQHYGCGDPQILDSAQAELHAVKLLMPHSAYVARLDFWLNFGLMTGGDDSPERASAVKDIVAKLARFPTYPSAHHARACYFDYIHEDAKAREEWDQVMGSGAGGWMHVYYAAFEYRQGDPDKAMSILNRSSAKSIWALLYRGEALALDGREDEARAVYEQVVEAIARVPLRPDDFIAIPEAILLLLGDQREAASRVSQRQDSIWPQAMLDFIARADMPAEELLAAMQGDSRNYNLVVAYKLIAYRHLCRGELELAEDALEKCQHVCYPQPDAFWAGAFRNRLQNDVQLRDRLEKRWKDGGNR